MIRFEKVCKSYKKSQILTDITFTINESEFVVFVGPSGCGKTTLLKIINKLIKPTSGKVYINGEDIEERDEIELRRNMGYVIQSIGLFPHMTIRENLELIPNLIYKDSKSVFEKSMELMDLVGLDPEVYLDRYPTQLSGGQQQRVGVARAFAIDPDIILMDEPFSALDPITRSQLQEELIHLQNKFKKTFVFVTHDMGEAIKLADKICIMNEGHIVQYDTPENILKRPADSFVRNFVGEHRIWSAPEFIRAKDIMIKGITANKNSRLLQCLEIMRNQNVDSLLIVDSKNRIEGIIYATDIMGHANIQSVAEDIMESVKSTVLPDESIIHVLENMQDKTMSAIPVVDDDGVLLGLITRSSLVTTLSQQYLESEGECYS